MRAIVSLLALSLLSGCSGQPTKEDAMSGKARLHYPATRQSEQVDHYFGQAVGDYYLTNPVARASALMGELQAMARARLDAPLAAE